MLSPRCVFVCASLGICSVLRAWFFFFLLLSFFFQWLDFVKLHYVYMKITSGVPDFFSIVQPLWGIQALSFSTAVSHYKGSHVEYKQRQQHSRLPVGFPGEITINISVSKNCSITCWCSYRRPIQLSLKKSFVKSFLLTYFFVLVSFLHALCNDIFNAFDLHSVWVKQNIW